MRPLLAVAVAVLAITGMASRANAALPVYPTPGVQNPTTYTFTAAGDGDLIAYFAGTTAAYSEILGVKINGVDSGITGLPNHATAIGASLDFGHVTAGDALEFYIDVLTTGNFWYSTKSDNLDGANHVFSAPYGGDATLPAGTYVALEDLPAATSNWNYFDETFVFSNVSTNGGGVLGIPEPATWTMMIAGFGLAGAALRRRRYGIVA
ncbi:MAG: pyruvate-binding protein [Phenylobacterium sp.]|jgi:hypothetical protein|nr:pyruvate-binding protein [Phenylobacterium sp.]